MRNRKSQVLLILVAILLGLNVLVTVVDWFVATPEAQANIVSGKNWFTTTSEDGHRVYMWQYWNNGVGEHAEGQIKYYGEIAVGGEFQGPK
ncbi:MAG: hypothetical protein P9L99_14555 [Candidatus Lernaella stagnicola]|nr:hypothetical protein [Candidatus Lernaella stagnicola]